MRTTTSTYYNFGDLAPYRTTITELIVLADGFTALVTYEPSRAKVSKKGKE